MPYTRECVKWGWTVIPKHRKSWTVSCLYSSGYATRGNLICTTRYGISKERGVTKLFSCFRSEYFEIFVKGVSLKLSGQFLGLIRLLSFYFSGWNVFFWHFGWCVHRVRATFLHFYFSLKGRMCIEAGVCLVFFILSKTWCFWRRQRVFI